MAETLEIMELDASFYDEVDRILEGVQAEMSDRSGQTLSSEDSTADLSQTIPIQDPTRHVRAFEFDGSGRRPAFLRTLGASAILGHRILRRHEI